MTILELHLYHFMAYTTLPTLLFELWGCIASYLSSSDIKNLRLSCVQFKNAPILRIDRVFLSANPLNVEVFRCIADHDKFRHSVTEIIWDDARLARGPHDSTNLPREMKISRTKMKLETLEGGFNNTARTPRRRFLIDTNSKMDAQSGSKIYARKTSTS